MDTVKTLTATGYELIAACECRRSYTMTAKKKAVKKKVVKKHATQKRKAPPKKKASTVQKAVAVSKKAAKPVPARQSNTVSKAPAKKGSGKTGPVKKKAAPKKRAPRNKKPLPKYHINHQSWDRPAAMDALCDIVMTSSQGLDTICKNNDDLPCLASVMNWLDEEARAGGGPLLERYARAKESQADYLADEMIDIADNQVSEALCIDGVPVKVDGKLIMVTTAASVNHARLRVDTRKFIAAKLKPHKYGDKLELSGNPDRPLAGLSEEQLIARQKMLEEKLASGSK